VGDEPVLADLDVLMAGVPDKADLVEEKTDQPIPKQFDLAEFQSPVRSQGRRGVCSIFSTTALMEHLYIKEGTITNPDFSEQFLQWSAKVEAGTFPHTGGSNARSNLTAISDYGIVAEADWPYESSKWTSSNDPACDGEDDMPTRCYTNGDPPPEALAAKRYTLPRGRWVSARPRSIKAFMVNKKQGVVAGMTFFYQSWNHGGSPLPVSSEYKAQGYIPYPNDTDKEKSLEKRAGHSILIIGWDDELEVTKRDENGNDVLDANGEPVKEKGFYLIKNSWGTGSFGTRNPFGAGYGWLSEKYVEDYASVYASDLPTVEIPDEVCGDEKDNDRDGLTDCDDEDCAELPQCQESNIVSYTNDQRTTIPDNEPAGADSAIEVTEQGEIQSLAVSVDIEHSYSGDVEIRLTAPDGTDVQLLEPTLESIPNIQETFVPEDFNGMEMEGTWTLKAIDHASWDEGAIKSWTLEITR
jgi:hypothetical protein